MIFIRDKATLYDTKSVGRSVISLLFRAFRLEATNVVYPACFLTIRRKVEDDYGKVPVFTGIVPHRTYVPDIDSRAVSGICQGGNDYDLRCGNMCLLVYFVHNS